MRHVSGSGEIGDVRLHCARTATRIRCHASHENEKQHPKPRRNLFMLTCWFCLLLCLCSCLCSICIPVQCVCVYVCVCARASVSVDELPTCVRTHFSVISTSPETPGSRSCDGDGNGLSNTPYSIFLWFVKFIKTLNIAHTDVRSQFAARTHLDREGKSALAMHTVIYG